MKIRDIKESKQINELDLSSFIGDRGAAAVRSGMDSLTGKATGNQSTEDRMAMDIFLKKFIGNASQAVNQAVQSGLVAKGTGATAQPQAAQPQATPAQAKPGQAQPAATPAQAKPGQAQPQAAQAQAQSPEQIRKQKQAAAGAVAQKQMAANPAPAKAAPAGTPAVAQTPAQIRQQKQAAATQTAQGQMAPFSKLPANQPAVQAGNIRQQKQAVAAKAAQGQMTPKVAGPTPKTPEQIRQAKQAAATAAAQGQMAPASKLPADQFAKSASNVRQQQQATATQTAQQQMATPQGYKSSDPRYPNGKYDGVTGKPTPEFQRDLDKAAADRAEKQKADAAASQAQAKSNDDMAANMNNIAAQRNMPEVPQATTPKISTGADAEQAALDKMKQKNPKLASMMGLAGLDDNLDDVKPKSPPGFNAQNVMNMPGMKKKEEPALAESSKFDKLNYIFESIVQEAGPQSISQYLMGFFKKFMTNVDPKALQASLPKAEALAKEAEASYPKMNAPLTKMAQLGWAVSHQQGEDEPQAATEPGATPGQTPGATTPGSTSQAGAPGQTPASPQAAQQKEKTVYAQVKGMLDKLDKKGKQRILAALEKSLGGATAPAAPAAPTAPATTPEPAPASDPGANAFAQMGKQITQPGVTNPASSTKTSTGGKVQQTGLGQVHTKSRANPNIKRKAPAVAESVLDGSVWGLK